MTVWISRRPDADIDTDLAASRAAGGALAGLRLAVKDNVDAAGLPTTAACPQFSYQPAADAPAVAALRAAGAVVVGKTNLDQFATGLVGTRSPYGAVSDTRRPDYISGGSSSGSAAAVASGQADIAIGTDTAGSGRVPAGLQGIVGIKPTLGVVSTDGVVPACESYDCVTILARDLEQANTAMAAMAAAGDRAWPADTRLAAPPNPVVAVPSSLPALDDTWQAAFAAAVQTLERAGARIVQVDIDPFLAAARLLYDGALVAERYAAVGEFIDSNPDADLDPTVRHIITKARDIPAHRLVADRREVARLRTVALRSLDGVDALLVPTAPLHPSLDQVAADPIGVNSVMGTYTNFCNLFDMCGVAVPAGTAGDAQFGVTVLARAFDDAIAMDIAAMAAGLEAPQQVWPLAVADHTELVVFGAHLRGGALVSQLTDLGARWDGELTTAPRYRMTVLPTTPAKPAVTRVADGADGAALLGHRWLLSPAALGRFLAALPAPMQLGKVEFADGSWRTAFAADASAATGPDISSYGSWPSAIAAGAV
ncbi:allophanate hydrolase [Mycolicibacterium canariasense]|uniref:Allophanate hydrolase n=1 Tax=Mycolicibacterium canariasense TaxID=228230 RepID=A0A100WF85_MYCCR|nr:allophanate hydrolase [Mycolicibacterium canariasense]MCV7211602.1 allophanate hydrolase [Mycolicibacterium canariasense]ORV00397.1 allophanate hydrolase [Mycolicibacterium canariasense]GAS96991.1 allophanate hydrolase [Mycolicibacterium canariasense]